jgi:hypothetical protein
MQNSTTTLLALFGLAGYSTYNASQTQSGSNGSLSPSIRLPKLAMKKVELQKQNPSLPDWAVMGGDMGLKFYRAVCCA